MPGDAEICTFNPHLGKSSSCSFYRYGPLSFASVESQKWVKISPLLTRSRNMTCMIVENFSLTPIKLIYDESNIFKLTSFSDYRILKYSGVLFVNVLKIEEKEKDFLNLKGILYNFKKYVPKYRETSYAKIEKLASVIRYILDLRITLNFFYFLF